MKDFKICASIEQITLNKHSIYNICHSTKELFLISDLLQCTNEPNVSVPQMANLLIERTQNTNWVVVFKSLVTIHNLMNYGNEVSVLDNYEFCVHSFMNSQT